MNILGLHFGHDAGVCVLRDGRIASCVVRERYCRTKHAISLQFSNIETAVAEAGLRLDQIDYCAVTSTQTVELIVDRPEELCFSFDAHPNHTAPSSFAALLKSQHADPARWQAHLLMDIFYDPKFRDCFLYRHYGARFPEYRARRREDFQPFGWIDDYVGSSLWKPRTLNELALENFAPMLVGDGARRGLHLPVTVRLAGRAVAGYFIAHHMAHAASCYYQSGFDSAAILTHDGYPEAVSYLTGLFCWAEGGRIFPLTPNYLTYGGTYEDIGARLGLGLAGAPGKLMGLAGYGKPRFFDRRTVGNAHDWAKICMNAESWWNHCMKLAGEMGYDLAPLADPARMTAPINVDIAASTQKLLEEGVLAAVGTLHEIMRRAGRNSVNLCMSGGTGLNCPANSRVFREGPFARIFVEPGCDDSGLAIGAATALYHNILDQPLPQRAPGVMASPYLGREIKPDEIAEALAAAGERIAFVRVPDAALTAAKDLAENKIIGWFEGASEIGPRALGHRSILADARHAGNWPRVNRLKGREAWRPFAPAVLESETEQWFHGVPNPSPYMLFTAWARTNQLPAITHADYTARIQTVGPACGEFFRLLSCFFELTGVPAVLNTSFNGPGEPIVETPAHAIHFLVSTALDALYIGGFRITRRMGKAVP